MPPALRFLLRLLLILLALALVLMGALFLAYRLSDRTNGRLRVGEETRRYLLYVLEAVKGNRSRAAEILGIDRRTLYRMAERFGIPLERASADS